jgi:hypothetical protein
MKAEQTDASDLDAQADEALEPARKLPHGPARSEAMRKARQLRRVAAAKGVTQYRHRRMSRAFAMYASVRHYLCELDPRVGDWNIGAG